MVIVPEACEIEFKFEFDYVTTIRLLSFETFEEKARSIAYSALQNNFIVTVDRSTIFYLNSLILEYCGVALLMVWR